MIRHTDRGLSIILSVEVILDGHVSFIEGKPVFVVDIVKKNPVSFSTF